MFDSTLSVVIVTKNEEEMIEGCIRSVSWADEIVVIDAESIDKTVSLAKKANARVYSHKWNGFATQKNYGISKASKKWILILDADERVSIELAKEIQEIINNTTSNTVSYDIPFRNFFLGKEMKHGGWGAESHIRLFLKGKARYIDQQIHEYLKIQGETQKLLGSIIHFSHRNIASNLLKTRQYNMVHSEIEVERGFPPVTKWSLFYRTIEHFWIYYIQLEGYKDGIEGLIEVIYQSFSQKFILDSMIWERQRKKTSQIIYKELEQKLFPNGIASIKMRKRIHKKR